MRSLLLVFLPAILLPLISACSPTKPAPVVNGWVTPAGKNSKYIVRSDDTIYSIAWVFGVDFKTIAAVNGLRPPYKLASGTQLIMPAPGTKLVTESSQQATSAANMRSTAPVGRSINKYPAATGPIAWGWPVRGKILARFKQGNPPNKGIDIAADYASPVRAAASGTVVYSGDRLPGYGKLIIIKSANNYMSAYAYNSQLDVKFGDRVTKGQLIAKVGTDQSGRSALHFEIRKNGKPINPLGLLN